MDSLWQTERSVTMETLNEIVRDLERMAQTLDFVKSTDEWADGSADIADIYRSVARRIRSVIGDTHAKGQGGHQ